LFARVSLAGFARILVDLSPITGVENKQTHLPGRLSAVEGVAGDSKIQNSLLLRFFSTLAF
jgi:hypothetical protein